MLEIPRLTITQHIAFGILCALEVCGDGGFVKWGNQWLEGKNRTESAAWAAMEAMIEAHQAAREGGPADWEEGTMAEEAATAATRAAWAGAVAIRVAAEKGEEALTKKAWAVAEEGKWAARIAARVTAEKGEKLDLKEIAKRAMKY